jgi:small GTP-binding protein
MIPKIVFCGLDRAGKTTIIKTIQEGELVQTMRTIGFTVDQITINNENLEILDLGGQIEFRVGWSLHLNSAGILIWVIDSSDSQRFSEAIQEFKKSIKYIPQNALVVVLANKQDLDTSVDEDEISKILDLQSLINKWHIFATSSLTTEGLRSAFSWIYENFSGKSLLKEFNYNLPLVHVNDGTFKCIYYQAGACPTPDSVPNSCLTCRYGSCQNCLNQIPDCSGLFPKFFENE